MTLDEQTGNQLTTALSPVVVAFDAAPLLSARTGVGEAVDMMQRHLALRDDVEMRPYVCSFRGQLQPGMKRLPIPAAVGQMLWSRVGWPRMDHWLHDAHVVHGTNYVVPPSRAAQVVTVYDCWFLREPDQASPAVARAGEVLRAAVQRGATVHASSQATGNAVRELLHTNRVEVIGLGPLPRPVINPADMHSPSPELLSKPFILALGTLERRKNLTAMVRAFAQLSGTNKDLHLVLAGADGDDVPAIEHAIQGLDSSQRSRIIRPGRVTEKEKAWLLYHAMVLGYPSLDEGFGFPLLEAMRYRLPIVASNAGSIPEVAGAAARLVAPDDIDALASELQTVVDDASLRDQLICAGQQQLALFSWDHTAEQLACLYQRLAQEHS